MRVDPGGRHRVVPQHPRRRWLHHHRSSPGVCGWPISAASGAHALAIVGAVSAVGAAIQARVGLVHWKAVLMFGAAGIPGAWFGAQLTHFVAPAALLLMFAGLMLLVTAKMWFGKKRGAEGVAHCHPMRCAMAGVAVGFVTGSPWCRRWLSGRAGVGDGGTSSYQNCRRNALGNHRLKLVRRADRPCKARSTELASDTRLSRCGPRRNDRRDSVGTTSLRRCVNARLLPFSSRLLPSSWSRKTGTRLLALLSTQTAKNQTNEQTNQDPRA